MSALNHRPSFPTAPPISAVGVGKRFVTDGREVVALDGIDISVQPGQFLSIIGGSGGVHISNSTFFSASVKNSP